MAEPPQGSLPGIGAPRIGALRRRGIYLLPNLFTTAALFAGFYAIVQAMNQRYDVAAVASLVAVGLDGLAGPAARVTRTQSGVGGPDDNPLGKVSCLARPGLVLH